MKIKEFLIAFGEYVGTMEDASKAELYDYIELLFENALQNFTDVICEKQRENCAREVSVQSNPNGIDDYIESQKPFIYAEQPKIEEL